MPTGSYFADWVLPQVQASLDDKYPAHSVRTTLKDRLQRAAVGAIRGVGTGGAQVALVAMRPDGRVVAMVGAPATRSGASSVLNLTSCVNATTPVVPLRQTASSAELWLGPLPRSEIAPT